MGGGGGGGGLIVTSMIADELHDTKSWKLQFSRKEECHSYESKGKFELKAWPRNVVERLDFKDRQLTV